MFLPQGGCKHPVIASEKPVPGFLLADAALTSGMVGKGRDERSASEKGVGNIRNRKVSKKKIWNSGQLR